LVDTEQFVLGWDEFAVNARVTLFYPDALEVTVGRFARFVEAFEEWTQAGNPRPGAGEHTFIPGTGWQAAFRLPVSRDALEAAVTSCAFVNTYTMRETNPELPMNCVSWFEAFAFCAWDGKRLLTEAEWELAAKGGIEDRVYPWGSEPEPTPDHAVYGCFASGSSAPQCEADDVLAVGSRMLGNSRHGLRDMAGSVAEWVFDKEGLYTDPCIDCANTESERNPTSRMFRGGDYSSGPVLLAAERRNMMDEAGRINFIGFRCARSLLYENP
jgi:formylglycine-generating enzyme required for sulfatase activity